MNDGKERTEEMDKDKRGGALQTVTFEQAQRLKAARFDVKCELYYDDDGKFVERNSTCNAFVFYLAPTVALALKWCRDVKGVWFDIRLCMVDGTYRGIIYKPWRDMVLSATEWGEYDDAESALLDAVLAEISEGGAK